MYEHMYIHTLLKEEDVYGKRLYEAVSLSWKYIWFRNGWINGWVWGWGGGGEDFLSYFLKIQKMGFIHLHSYTCEWVWDDD